MPRISGRQINGGLLDYSEVRRRIGDRTSYLLLGNGFSIACDPVFRYASLYQAAIDAGLSERAQRLFERMGTNNFEGIMKMLEDSHWVAWTYELIRGNSSPMLEDLEVIKRTLVEAIAHSHLEHSGDVPDERKAAAARFVEPYHIVFTTNYDLLLYWVTMFASDPPLFEDGFRADPDNPDAPYLVFTQRLGQKRGVLYLHGALHMYLEQGELRKHSWTRTGIRLTELIREGLETGQYPLFVAEGTPEKKHEQIQGNGYLWYCLDKFHSIQSPLVIFGHSLGTSDGHILDAIATNPKLPALYIGLHGDPESPSSQATRAVAHRLADRRAQLRGRPTPLEVFFYNSDSAEVWNSRM
jgi:hypothetical protein